MCAAVRVLITLHTQFSFGRRIIQWSGVYVEVIVEEGMLKRRAVNSRSKIRCPESPYGCLPSLANYTTSRLAFVGTPALRYC